MDLSIKNGHVKKEFVGLERAKKLLIGGWTSKDNYEEISYLNKELDFNKLLMMSFFCR